MNTCENHLIIQGTHNSLDRLAWQLEARVFPEANPFSIEIDSNVLYAHFWTAAPPIEALEALPKDLLVSFTYCDRTYDLVGEYEPLFGHRPGRTKGLERKYQLAA